LIFLFQKSEQIFEENKIDQDKCGAEAWGYASAGKIYLIFEYGRSIGVNWLIQKSESGRRLEQNWTVRCALTHF